jgi:hypothetical protein
MKRVMKASAAYYSKLIKDNGFVRSSCPYYDVMAGTSSISAATPTNNNYLSPCTLLLALFIGLVTLNQHIGGKAFI